MEFLGRKYHVILPCNLKPHVLSRASTRFYLSWLRFAASPSLSDGVFFEDSSMLRQPMLGTTAP